MKGLALRSLVVCLGLTLPVVPRLAHAQSRDFAEVMASVGDRSPGSALYAAAISDARVASDEKLSPADLKIQMAYRWQALEAIKPADFEIYGAKKGDVARLVAEQKEILRASYHATDPEAGKKAYLDYQKNVAAQYKAVAVKDGIGRELPDLLRVTDAMFAGTTNDDLKKPSASIRADDVEGRAVAANLAIGHAKALLEIAKSDPRVFDDAVIGARQDPARVKARLEEVVKTNEARLAAMKESWDGRKKEIAALPKYTGPSIGLPGRPVPGPAFLSPQQMVADGLIPGAGAADKVGSRVGLGYLTGPLKAIDMGYSAGGYYENSALVLFQNAERAKMRQDYEARVKDWEKNVRPQIEKNERQAAIDSANWRARQASIEFMLGGGGLPPVIKFGDTVIAPGFNGSRFAETRPLSPSITPYYRANPSGGGVQR